MRIPGFVSTTSTLAAVATLALVLLSQSAVARAIRIDLTLAFCNIDEAAGAEIAIGHLQLIGGTHTSQSDCQDPALFDPFSVRIGNATYNTLHLNNDGLITFGSAYSGTPLSLTDSAFGPAFAPFFTNTPFSDASGGGTPRISWGGVASSTTPYLSLNYASGNSGSYYQVNLLDRSADTGVAGDFDLEFSYARDDGTDGIVVDQGGAQVGFNNGAGQAYLLPGSGVAGAFIGDAADCGTATISPFALACSNFGTPEAGGLLFQFRNGVALGFPVDPEPVPAPAPLGMLLAGLWLLRRRQGR